MATVIGGIDNTESAAAAGDEYDTRMVQLVQGLAMGLFFVTLLAVIFDGLPAHKVPAASGLSNFARITAASFATSLTTTF